MSLEYFIHPTCLYLYLVLAFNTAQNPHMNFFLTLIDFYNHCRKQIFRGLYRSSPVEELYLKSFPLGMWLSPTMCFRMKTPKKFTIRTQDGQPESVRALA